MTEKKLEREFVMKEYSYDFAHPKRKLRIEGEKIVRCSRCKYWHKHALYGGSGMCSIFNGAIRAWYDFCSDGDDEK